MITTDETREKLIAIADKQRDIYQMEHDCNKMIRELYPPGSIIGWQRGGNNLSGDVVDDPNGTRIMVKNKIMVKNSLTLKEYYIDIYDVLLRENLADRMFDYDRS